MSERFHYSPVMEPLVPPPVLEPSFAPIESAQFAFSLKTKKKIKERDGGKSVWSGETDNLQAAHINHDKSLPNYDSTSNGRMLTQKEQYIDHFNRHGSTDIGLTTKQNKSALGIIYHSLKGNRDDLPPPSEVGTKSIKLPKKKWWQ